MVEKSTVHARVHECAQDAGATTTDIEPGHEAGKDTTIDLGHDVGEDTARVYDSTVPKDALAAGAQHEEPPMAEDAEDTEIDAKHTCVDKEDHVEHDVGKDGETPYDCTMQEDAQDVGAQHEEPPMLEDEDVDAKIVGADEENHMDFDARKNTKAKYDCKMQEDAQDVGHNTRNLPCQRM